MNIVVSDYDDTFYINDSDIKENVNIVNKFMKDNLFVIATGRSYSDFLNVRNLYNIPYNYLIINHGATILNEDKVIYNSCIDNEIKEKLIDDLELENTEFSFACSTLDSRVSLDTSNLTKIQVRYNNVKKAEEINKKLLEKYSDKINTFLVCNKEAIEIVSSNVNKSDAIKYIAKLEKVNNSKIYTIGDSYSDIKMIKDFNGYCMTNSIKELKEIAIKEVDSVSILINEVMRDSNE